MPTRSPVSPATSCSVTRATTLRAVISPGGRRSAPHAPSWSSSAAPRGWASRRSPPSSQRGLGITRVIPTDTVREVMRTFMPPLQAPELHSSSFEVGGGADELIDGFLRQSRSVATGIDGLVGRMIAEHKDSIVEGIHLVPGMLDEEMLHRFRLEAAVVKVLLTLPDASVHRAHFIGRLESEHGRRPERYLRNLSEIRRIQAHLEDFAGPHGFSLVDATDLDGAIQQVLDLVVAEVTSITGESQVVVAG